MSPSNRNSSETFTFFFLNIVDAALLTPQGGLKDYHKLSRYTVIYQYSLLQHLVNKSV